MKILSSLLHFGLTTLLDNNGRWEFREFFYVLGQNILVYYNKTIICVSLSLFYRDIKSH